MTPFYYCSVCDALVPFSDGHRFRGRFVCAGCGRRVARRARARLVGAGLATVAVLTVAGIAVSRIAAPVRAAENAGMPPAGVDGPRPALPSDEPISLTPAADEQGRVFVSGPNVELAGRFRGRRPLTAAFTDRVQEVPLSGDGTFALALDLGTSTRAPLSLSAPDTARPFQVELVVDDIAPVIDVVSPDGGATLTRDDTFDIVVRVAEEHLRSVRVAGRSLVAAPDGTWVAAFLQVDQEGAQEFLVRAEDLAGNATEKVVVCTRDTHGPKLAAAAPSPDSPLERGESIAMSLTFDENVRTVELNGTPLAAEGRTATGSIPWPAVGGTWTAKIRSIDVAGNQTSTSIEYRLPAPELVLASFSDPRRYYTADGSVRLQGRVLNPLKPHIAVDRPSGSVEVPLGVDGSFTAELGLVNDSAAMIELRIPGVELAHRIELIRDSTAPAIVLVSPGPDGARVATSTVDLLVSMTDENPGKVTLGSTPLEQQADGTWLAHADLPNEGVNELRFAASDLAGNVGTLKVEITRDTTGPALKESTPDVSDLIENGWEDSLELVFDEPLWWVSLDGREIPVDGNRALGIVSAPTGTDADELRVTVRAADKLGNERELELRFAIRPPIGQDLIGFTEAEVVRQLGKPAHKWKRRAVWGEGRHWVYDNPAIVITFSDTSGKVVRVRASSE